MDEFNQRLQIQDMMESNKLEDMTDKIRMLKHSKILKEEVNKMIEIKTKFLGDDLKITEECISEASFIFTYYTDIFNKIKKDEIDLTLLNLFLNILEKIEEGELDQEKASLYVSSVLQKLYKDSADKKSQKLDEMYPQKEVKKDVKNTSWREYKKQNKK
jgi:predicted transcriptional regulator